jgi:membrane protease YdiL (CAAX protease family)
MVLDVMGRSAPPLSMQFSRAAVLAICGCLLPGLLRSTLPDVWARMAVVGTLLAAAAAALVRLDWRALLRPKARLFGIGAASAFLLYLCGLAFLTVASVFPGTAEQLRAIYAWRDAVPLGRAALLLPLIVTAEEAVWRNAITLPFAARLGPVAGAVLASALFAIAHAWLELPLLVAAAFGAGLLWSALVVWTRSSLPALASHLVWEYLVLYAMPYTSA